MGAWAARRASAEVKAAKHEPNSYACHLSIAKNPNMKRLAATRPLQPVEQSTTSNAPSLFSGKEGKECRDKVTKLLQHHGTSRVPET
jgi:hypothetical protein